MPHTTFITGNLTILLASIKTKLDNDNKGEAKSKQYHSRILSMLHPMGGLPLLRQGEHLSPTRQAYVRAGYRTRNFFITIHYTTAAVE